MSKFNVGDRFFLVERGTYFILIFYNTDNDFWDVQWSDSRFKTSIYPEELERLRYFSFNLIKIKDDKHLLELQLKY